MKKQSELLKEKQAIAKAEITNVIKNALPQDGSKMEFGLDKWPLSIGYSISCECFDDLDFLYVDNNSVLASFCQEPDNEVELECFHESSLIDVVDYLERHGFISQNKVQKMNTLSIFKGLCCANIQVMDLWIFDGSKKGETFRDIELDIISIENGNLDDEVPKGLMYPEEKYGMMCEPDYRIVTSDRKSYLFYKHRED